MGVAARQQEEDGVPVSVNKTLMMALAAASLVSAAAAAAELPDGPNRDLVERACTACHDLEMILDAAGQDRGGWSGTIDEMTGYGMRVSPQEREQMLDYLTRVLGPDARGPH